MADEPFDLPYSLHVRPAKDFNYDSGKTKLINLRLGEEDGPTIRFIVPGDVVAENIPGDGTEEEVGRREHLLRLSGWVNLECPLTVGLYLCFYRICPDETQVGCAGALLSYLQRRRAASYLPGDRSAYMFFRVSSVQMFSLEGSM